MNTNDNSNLNNEKMELNVKIGQRIAELRKLAQKSQKDVVIDLQLEGIYITNKMLSKYEKGQISLPLDVLIGLSDLYCKDINYILRGTVPDSSYSEQELEEFAECSQKLSAYFSTLLSPKI